jgi:hypothetical protein
VRILGKLRRGTRAILVLGVALTFVPLLGGTASATSESGEYTPITPTRMLDTRSTLGGHPGALGFYEDYSVTIAGVSPVPAAASVLAVVMNVTAVTPTANGALIVWPDGTNTPASSSLNFTVGKTVPNLVTVQIGQPLGRVDILNSSIGSTHVIVDVVGYYSTTNGPDGSRFHGLNPVRLFDTRNNTGGVGVFPVGPGGIVHFDVRNQGGIPSAPSAVALNVTVVKATTKSYLTVYPDDVSTPLASNLNFVANQTVPNMVIVRVPASGIVDFYNGAGSVHILADVVGYYDDVETTQAGRFIPVLPCRLFDSRWFGVKLGPSEYAIVDVADSCGVPSLSSVSSGVFNVTVTQPTGSGFETVFPDDLCFIPVASNLNFVANLTVANAVVSRVSQPIDCYAPPAGAIDVFNGAGFAHVIVDVFGYFSTASTPGFFLTAGVSGTSSQSTDPAPLRIRSNKPQSPGGAPSP